MERMSGRLVRRNRVMLKENLQKLSFFKTSINLKDPQGLDKMIKFARQVPGAGVTDINVNF